LPWFGWLFGRGRQVAWETIVAHLDQAVASEADHVVHGTLHGVAMRLRYDRASRTTSIEATRPIDDRFSLRIVPMDGSREFASAFAVRASPLDLPRIVLDDEVRTRLLVIEPRPTVHLEAGQLRLEVGELVDASSAIAGLEVVARLARALEERGAMCARP